jgi:hypothetical protein
VELSRDFSGAHLVIKKCIQRRILQQLEQVWQESNNEFLVAFPERTGIYLEFISSPGFELAIKSLENLRQGIRLCNVRAVKRKVNEEEIRRNLLRSSLTSLGVVIGVSAVITMVTVGNGATKKVKEEVESLGANMLIIRPGQRPRHFGVRETARPFRLRDAEAIKREVYGIEAVAPASSSGTQAIYGDENWSTIVTGSTNDFLDVRDWQLDMGRRFLPGEERSGQAVCILGHTVYEKLFGDEYPIGKRIRLKKISFKVVGVL